MKQVSRQSIIHTTNKLHNKPHRLEDVSLSPQAQQKLDFLAKQLTRQITREQLENYYIPASEVLKFVGAGVLDRKSVV